MEKPQLINFVAKVMEDSGFKVYKNFKTSQRIIDIYAILPTNMGDFSVVIACDNSDKNSKVGMDLLKEMEDALVTLKASKATVITSAFFSDQASNYASRKNIKLVDREGLTEMAKKYKSTSNHRESDEDGSYEEDSSNVEEDYPEYSYDASDMEYLMGRQNAVPYRNTLYPHDESPVPDFLKRRKKSPQTYGLYPVDVYDTYYYEMPLFYRLQPYLSNAFISILLVVIVSFLMSVIFGSLLKIDYGISGLIEMLTALILSYGIAFIFIEDKHYAMTRGTVVFFISIIILIIMVIVI